MKPIPIVSLSGPILTRPLTKCSSRTLTSLSTGSPAARRRASPCPCFNTQSAFKPKAQARHASFQQGLRSTYKSNPIMLPLGLISFALAAGYFCYSNYLYYKTLQDFASYPENVGLKLRRALYFTHHKFEPVHAARAFHQALKLADQEGMDPFSDEVIGIKLEMARFLEVANNYESSIQVLEAVRSDCLKWVDHFGGKEGYAADRTRILAKSVQTAIKLADLYSIDFIADRQKAEELLVWAVETSLKEKQRRDKEGVKPDEGDWLDDDQIGAELERLGLMYESQGNYYFAAQLLLQAVALKTEKDCHLAMLMISLGACMGHQRPPPQPSQPAPSPEQLRESGRMWINKGLELSRNIKPPVRNAECDESCISAAANLATFARMDGNVAEARDKYEEAGSLANAIGYTAGIVAANEGLRGLESEKSNSKWW